jgi:hypothetical protein
VAPIPVVLVDDVLTREGVSVSIGNGSHRI